jgi:hypothetical protein
MGARATSATAANALEQTIDPGIFLVDPLGQGIFTGLNLVGAFNIIPGWLPDLRSVHDRSRRPQHDSVTRIERRATRCLIELPTFG